jgi:hypothetical protein
VAQHAVAIRAWDGDWALSNGALNRFSPIAKRPDVTYIYGQSPLPGSVAGLYGRATKIYRTDRRIQAQVDQGDRCASLAKLPNSDMPSSGCMQLGRNVILSRTRFRGWRFKPDHPGLKLLFNEICY